MVRTSYVYLLTNANHPVLYPGVPNDLTRRVAEHQAGVHEGFTQKCNVHKLVHFETYPDINAAISRKKQLKAGLRAKKVALIDSNNPAWEELAG